jgi:transcriptional regulator with XRE-family HTH domain
VDDVGRVGDRVSVGSRSASDLGRFKLSPMVAEALSEADLGTFGRRVRSARLAAGLTQKDVADECGKVSSAYISRIESGTRRPSVEVLLGMSRAIGVSAAALVGMEPVDDRQASQREPIDVVLPRLLREASSLTGQRRRKLEAQILGAAARIATRLAES